MGAGAFRGGVRARAPKGAGAAGAPKARGLWKVERFDRVKKWGNGKNARVIKRDPDTGLWWSRDTAQHGGSEWKVFRENRKGLEHYRDADQFGDFIVGKHKGDVGKFIQWSELY